QPGIDLGDDQPDGGLLGKDDHIIANPNCSTIQMLMVLAPLHQAYRIRRIVVSTYQSVSGTGIKALRQLEQEEKAALLAAGSTDKVAGEPVERAYHHPIYRNCIPQCDSFLDNGYTKEEMKMVNETRKILGDNSIMVTATTVRVPVTGGHSEAVNIEFERDYELAEVRRLLSETPGVVVVDNPAAFEYPMALHANEKDEVFVGRIRRDESRNKCLNLWVVSDNLRKGAATNAIQIAEHLVSAGII
ncbi:MAG: aspartate-semialdehyde dehydrogenase, partial [Bacteroidales bacterium]